MEGLVEKYGLNRSEAEILECLDLREGREYAVCFTNGIQFEEGVSKADIINRDASAILHTVLNPEYATEAVVYDMEELCRALNEGVIYDMWRIVPIVF